MHLSDPGDAIRLGIGMVHQHFMLIPPFTVAENVETLSVGIEQRIEIIKVFYRGAKILILYEPTAVLTPQEVDELFEIMRSLKDQGKRP